MGPLHGTRFIEVGSIGPGPFCAMLLADLGAKVLRVDRLPREGQVGDLGMDAVMLRGRRSVALDLRTPEGVATVLRLVERADGLIEGFRPGVTDRLGIGPEACLARNPRLVYGRMTGWGQDGPAAQQAGHDINYIALAGVLASIGRPGAPPVPPLNLVGDFGGGGMLLALGLVAALLESRTSGRGQVVDAAMVDGAALLMTLFHGALDQGAWVEERGQNLLDTAAHFYEVYETADGGHMAVGAIEPEFYAELLDKLGLAGEDLPDQLDRSRWPEMKDRFAAAFRRRTREEWSRVFEGSDACATPVLSMSEAPRHPHNAARSTFVESDGLVQPAPAPRFSRTPGVIQGPPPRPGQHTEEGLRDWGLAAEDIDALRRAGAIR